MTLHGSYGAGWVYANTQRIRLTCSLCGEKFYYGSRNRHSVHKPNWTIYCPKTCPKCGDTKYRSEDAGWTHHCGFDLNNNDTFYGKDYGCIDGKELRKLQKYLDWLEHGKSADWPSKAQALNPPEDKGTGGD